MGNIGELIAGGKAILGIEFGSTRIKAVLIDEAHKPIASGDHVWENRLENGFWTYHDDEIWAGLQDAYANLKKDVADKYDVELTKVAALGFSAMMHGYLAFDKDGNLLVPFRTWRNSTTGPAAAELSQLFSYNIRSAEYLAFVSGDLKRRRPCKRPCFLYDAGRLYPLAHDRGKGAGCR